MHTNIDVNEVLLSEAQALGHYKTKKETVNGALAEFVRTRKQGHIRDLFGTIDIDPDYDYKAERTAR